MDKVFEDDDLVDIMKTEKTELELKQFSVPPIIKGIGSLFHLGIIFVIVVYFILPYISAGEDTSPSSLYSFAQTDANPFKKVSKRFKVRYYIGNSFKE